ncbi:MAG TPA: metal/formaldehyde-sensitive transcriptional repressor [Verrucomicrobiae bacterium]|nr:metal/formaldehyde-sensitive transcriptional repressor [Verrucomicrobiae bacterium]
MAHTVRDKQKLLMRVRRIRGQVNALERLLEAEADCSKTLHLTVACRGAINSLMAEILEGHIRFHIINPDDKPTSEQAEAAEDVIDVVRSYLK